MRRLALAVLLTSASLFVGPPPARGVWGAKPPSSKEARHSLAVSVAPVPERSSPGTLPFHWPSPDASVPFSSPQDAPSPSSPPPRSPSTSAAPAARSPSRTSTRSSSAGSGPATRRTPSSATSGGAPSSPSSRRTRRAGTAASPSGSSRPGRRAPGRPRSATSPGTVYERGAWAVIGGVDGTTTHLAVQVALKSHFLLLSPGSTDVTADRANVPWLFSLPPSDERHAAVIGEGLEKSAAGGAVAVAAATDHDSHATLVAVRRELARRRLAPATLVEFAAARARPRGRSRRDWPPAAPGPCSSSPRRPWPDAWWRPCARPGSAGRSWVGPPPRARPSGGRRARRPRVSSHPLPRSRGRPGTGSRELTRRGGRRPPTRRRPSGTTRSRLVAAAVRRAGLNRALVRDAVRALAPVARRVRHRVLERARPERERSGPRLVERRPPQGRPPAVAPQRAARSRTASTGPPAASRGGRMRRPPFASRSFSAVAKSILRCGRRAVPPGSVPRSRSVMTAG